MGRKTLRINGKLCRAARGHCKDMKEHSFFAHRSPVKGKETFQLRAKLEGTRCTSEIITRAGSADGAFCSWFGSPAHHKAIFYAGFQIGAGTYQGFWTAMF